jgi:phosphoribosylformimino-5-aminoimidazole carboxamide ribotide isomerase
MLKAGIERVILGTAAVEDPEVIKQACKRFGENIIVGIDARDGYVSTHGWKKDTELTTIELARAMVKLGVRRFIYTDISRDGTLTEPNFSAFSELLHAIRWPVIASGGVSSLNHLRMLKSLGAEGAIVGKALYTGDIDLKEALATIS